MKKLMNLKRVILFAIFLALIISPAYAQQLKSELIPSSNEKAKIQFVLTNTTNYSLYILKYETPIEGLTRDLFDIQCNGKSVPYMGIMVLRRGPRTEDWLEIEAGESISTEVNLAKYYAIEKVGQYTVRYQSLQNVVSAVSKRDLSLASSNPNMIDSKEISIFVNKVVSESRSEYSNTSEGSQYKTRACTNEQSSILRRAESSCSSLASYGGSQVGNNSWYINWFGNYNASNADFVRSMFGSIEGSCGGNTNYCGGKECKSDYYAYVYPNYPGHIWYCDLFWGAGSTEQGSVVLHEISHFYGAEDYGYGPRACQDLARNNPDMAINNADNYRLSTLN